MKLSDISQTMATKFQIQETLWQDWNTKSLFVVSALVILAITTRFLTGLSSPSKLGQDGLKSVPLVPYWLPIIGHIPQFSLAPESLLNRARDAYNGVFALNLGSKIHNLVYSPSMGASLMNQRHSIANMDSVGKHILTAVFSYPKNKKALDRYDEATPGLSACYKHILSEPSLGEMVQRTVDVTKLNIANLVTFSESKVDQVEWERTSKAETVTRPNGEKVVEASLLYVLRSTKRSAAKPH